MLIYYFFSKSFTYLNQYFSNKTNSTSKRTLVASRKFKIFKMLLGYNKNNEFNFF